MLVNHFVSEPQAKLASDRTVGASSRAIALVGRKQSLLVIATALLVRIINSLVWQTIITIDKF